MSRPIDSENLYKFLTDQRVKERGAYSKGVNIGLDIARSALRNEQIAPTLTPKNEWVSVEDTMPPEHELVLCIVNGRPRSNVILEDAYQLGSWNKADGWIINEWQDWEGANVSHWALLPAPPNRRPPEGGCEIKDYAETCGECRFCDTTLASPPEGENGKNSCIDKVEKGGTDKWQYD